MVRRIKRDRFDKWWKEAKERWDESGSCLSGPFLIFRIDERAAKAYRRQQLRYARQRPADLVWHATYLHRKYGERHGHR